MSQENSKKPASAEKGKSAKGKIAAAISIVVILAVVGVLAFIFTRPDSPEDYKYSLTITDATISGLENKNLESLRIPDDIDGVPVTIISANAFEKCTAITSVKLPKNLKKIGNSAFTGCGRKWQETLRIRTVWHLSC